MEMILSFIKGLLGYLRFIYKLFKWSTHRVAQLVFAPIAAQSHQVYIDRRRSRLRWEPLVQGIEYITILESVLSNEPNPVSLIYLRNAGSDTVDRLDIFIVAQRGNLEFSQFETIFRLDAGKIREIKLHNIPLQDILEVTEKTIIPAYERFSVSASKLIVGDMVQDFKPLGPCESLSLDEFFNSRWWRFDGYLFNMDAIEEFKRELLCQLSYYLLTRSMLFRFSVTEQLRWIFQSRGYRFLPNILLFWALSPNWVRSIACWTLLILRVRKLQIIPSSTPTN